VLITESKLREIIRVILKEATERVSNAKELEEADDEDEESSTWKPPWEGGGSGSGGHAEDYHWADTDSGDYDDY
tara:strand:- start:327 stop:548 length:222 start_codon:yes stop_codon:yes gene_type:complete